MLNKNDKFPKAKIVRINPNSDDYLSDFFIIHAAKTADVCKELSTEVTHWSPEMPVFIDAGTGTGKSTFVIDCLYRMAKEAGKKILIVSNRTALNTQYKKQLMKLEESTDLRWLTDEGIASKSEFEGVAANFVSYQGLSGFMATVEADDFQFVVLDEAQYFCSDSAFSSNVDYVLSRIPSVFRHSIRLYMTATPWVVRNVIAGAERMNHYDMLSRLQSLYDGSLVLPNVGIRHFHYYRFPFKPRKYQLKYLPAECRDNLLYNNILPQLIEKSKPEKWIVFVDSKEHGKSLEEALKGTCSVQFLDAEKKGSKMWNDLVSKGSFDDQVLITTSVLDSGFNLADSTLKNIVITSMDRVTFLQELGRKRFLSDEEIVDVYVPDINIRQIKRACWHYQKLSRAIREHEGCPYKENTSKFREYRARELRNQYFNGTNESRHLFPVGMDGEIHLSICAKERVLHQEFFLQLLAAQAGIGMADMEDDMPECSDDDIEANDDTAVDIQSDEICDFGQSVSPFMKHVCSWLGVERGEFACDPETLKRAFSHFLQESCGSYETQEGKTSFQETFWEKYTAAYGKRKNRNDSDGIKAMSNQLKEIKLPYKLIGTPRNTWTLQASEENGSDKDKNSKEDFNDEIQ